MKMHEVLLPIFLNFLLKKLDHFFFHIFLHSTETNSSTISFLLCSRVVFALNRNSKINKLLNQGHQVTTCDTGGRVKFQGK